MQDPLHRADYYRQKAMQCQELAKYAQFAFLSEFYRRHVVRYMFMAEDILNVARARGEIADRRAAPSSTIATSSERRGTALARPR